MATRYCTSVPPARHDAAQPIAGSFARRGHAAVLGVGDVLLTFFFLHSSSVTAYNSVVPGGWSIAVEMQFNLPFPLLIYLFRRRLLKP